jgi:hypothetical protein
MSFIEMQDPPTHTIHRLLHRLNVLKLLQRDQPLRAYLEESNARQTQSSCVTFRTISGNGLRTAAIVVFANYVGSLP